MSARLLETRKVDINLVPLIDILFQLIAFFTMVVNLDQSNTDERVRLPIADLASPSEMEISEMLMLNINRHGQVTLLGGELVSSDDAAFSQYLAREADAAQKAMKRAGQDIREVGGAPQLWTTVMIRADKEVGYGRVQRVMRMCQELGFYKFALRASPSQASM